MVRTPPLQLIVVNAEHRHARQLAPRLRQVDVEELRLFTDQPTALESLYHSMDSSDEAYAVLAERTVVGLMGLASHPTLEDVGIPWMVGSPLLTADAWEFVQTVAPFWCRWKLQFSTLANCLLEDNHLHRDLLDRIGFEAHGPFDIKNKRGMTYVWSYGSGSDRIDRFVARRHRHPSKRGEQAG